jgi:CubicO group peptidase (beta-lactamase class C family)
MTMARRTFASVIAGAAIFGAARAQTPGAELRGAWSGVLRTGGPVLRLRLVVPESGDSVLYSLDQGNAAIPIIWRSVEPRAIKFEAPSVRGVFEGALQDGAIVGEWRQGAALPLRFLRGDQAFEEADKPAPPLNAQRLKEIRTQAGSPALIAAARKNAATPIVLVDGLRNAARSEPTTPDDQWHIGSCTKSMTATLVARLVEGKLIAWGDTVGDVLKDVAPNMRADYRAATFKHLLSHRAGLAPNISMLDLVRFQRVNPDPREERKEYVRKALAMAPAGPMEQTFAYSNNSYVVAGAMLEAKLGQRWEDLIRTHVFEPLNMRGAGFGAPGAKDAHDQPVGHAKGLIGERRQPFMVGKGVTDNPAVLGPAGTVHARAADMLAYLDAHRTQSAFLSRESWAILHTPPFGGDYAMGWIVRRDGSLWHNGSNTLWYAEMAFDRAEGVSAFACANDGFTVKSEVAVSAALAGAMRAASA